jgi:hypothetical protein
VVFVGREPGRIGEPTEVNEIAGVEWVPLSAIPRLISDGQIWNAGSLVALLRLLTMDSQDVTQ